MPLMLGGQGEHCEFPQPGITGRKNGSNQVLTLQRIITSSVWSLHGSANKIRSM